MGGCKAPKSPDRLREYYNFCTIHAREYNKNWNFFSNMSDEDIAEWQVGARHGRGKFPTCCQRHEGFENNEFRIINQINSVTLSFSLGRRCRKAADEGTQTNKVSAPLLTLRQLPSPALRAPSPQGEGEIVRLD